MAMKSTVSIFIGLTAILCLTLLGPSGMGMTGADSTAFAMVICADGDEKAVLIGIDGQPAEPTNPSQDCFDCLMCCTAAKAHLDQSCDAAWIAAVLKTDATRVFLQRPAFIKRNILPEPRGPPVEHLSILVSAGLIGRITRSDGRPFRKDADV